LWNRSAITKLDEDEYENRFSAHEVQALCYLELRLKDEALESLDRARELADKCSSAARTRLIWTDVYARREVLSFLESAASFEEIAKFFHRSGDVLSEILAVLEYVNCYLLAGNNAVAISAAQALKRFAFRETSHIVDAAIMNVYRAALEGQNIALLGEVLTATLVTVKAAVEGSSTAASPN
jgi:tetratricopeptide (TPR) repeat protein